MSTKPIWFAAKVALSVGLLALLLQRLGVESVLEVVGDANPLLLAIGGVCLIGQTAISSIKWKLLLEEQGQHVRYSSLLVTYLISNFINLFMPSVAGGDAYRAIWLRKHTKSIAAALPSIVVDRATGIGALLILAGLGLTLMAAPEHLALALTGLIAAGIIGYLLIAFPIARAAARLPRRVFFNVAGIVSDALQAVKPSRCFFMVLVLSFLFQFNTILINWLYASSMHLSVTLLELLLIVPVVYLVETVPISLNGVGVREGTFTFLFAQMGLPPEEGLALGLTVTMMRYIVGLVGGSLLTASLLRRPVTGETTL